MTILNQSKTRFLQKIIKNVESSSIHAQNLIFLKQCLYEKEKSDFMTTIDTENYVPKDQEFLKKKY